MKKETKVAYHEAGHALACYISGVRFKKVTIIPGKDFLGCIVQHKISNKLGRDLGWFDNTETQIWHLHQILISLSGAEATRLVCGRSERYDHAEDYQLADEYARAECGSAEVAKAYIKFLRLLAKELVKTRREELDKIADALLVKKTLTQKEVKELLE